MRIMVARGDGVSLLCCPLRSDLRGGTAPATDAATAAMDRFARTPSVRRTPRVRLPDCEALDAAQVFGFAMKHPVGWRIEASSTLLQRPRRGLP